MVGTGRRVPLNRGRGRRLGGFSRSLVGRRPGPFLVAGVTPVTAGGFVRNSGGGVGDGFSRRLHGIAGCVGGALGKLGSFRRRVGIRRRFGRGASFGRRFAGIAGRILGMLGLFGRRRRAGRLVGELGRLGRHSGGSGSRLRLNLGACDRGDFSPIIFRNRHLTVPSLSQSGGDANAARRQGLGRCRCQKT